MENKLITDFYVDIQRFINKIKENPNHPADIDSKLRLFNGLQRVIKLKKKYYKDEMPELLSDIDRFIKDLKDVFCETDTDLKIWNESIIAIRKDVLKGKVYGVRPTKPDKDHTQLNEQILWLIIHRFEYLRKLFEPIKFKKGLENTENKIQFEDLFINKSKINMNERKEEKEKAETYIKELDTYLRSKGFFHDGKWQFQYADVSKNIGAKKDLAIIFYALQDIGIIKNGKFAPMIKVFYKRYGLNAVEKINDPQIDVTIKNLRDKTGIENHDLYKDIQQKFRQVK